MSKQSLADEFLLIRQQEQAAVKAKLDAYTEAANTFSRKAASNENKSWQNKGRKGTEKHPMLYMMNAVRCRKEMKSIRSQQGRATPKNSKGIWSRRHIQQGMTF